MKMFVIQTTQSVCQDDKGERLRWKANLSTGVGKAGVSKLGATTEAIFSVRKPSDAQRKTHPQYGTPQCADRTKLEVTTLNRPPG